VGRGLRPGYDPAMVTPLAAAQQALEHPGFSDGVRALARRGEVRRYPKGTLLIQEGDVGDTVYVILAGRVRAFGSSDSSEREVTYGLYGPGDYVGEMGLDGGPRSASVVTLEPTLCAVITKPTLLAHIGQQPEFALELLARVIRSARSATLSTKQLALNDVYGRLRQLLESLALPQPDGTWRLAERLTHQEMAHRVGCSREMVSRVMKDLETGGYVRGARGQLQLLRTLPVRW